tara:strand:- start:2122 stop:2601 length:480 start_codon:yes stop_codon:yes gene_type:complete
MSNVIEAEERFVSKEKDTEKNPIQEAHEMLGDKKVWFGNVEDGIEVGSELHDRMEKAHGKYADAYLMFIVHQFASGNFGPTDVLEDYKRMNNLVMHRRVRGCYPIDPDIDDRKNNEMWMITDDGHTRLLAVLADEDMDDFYGEDCSCSEDESSDDDESS